MTTAAEYTYVLTEAEARWLVNRMVLTGSFGTEEVDYAAEAEASYWDAQVSANPDGPGSTTGDRIEGTVNGQKVWASRNPGQRAEDQIRYAANERSKVADRMSLVSPDYRLGDHVVLRGESCTFVRVDRTFDGSRATASKVNGAKRSTLVEGVTLTGAERKAMSVRKARERKAREAGADWSTIQAEREAWLAKRAAKDAESAERVRAAIAAGSSGWDHAE